jgi:DNA-binding PadR family transcriptional regulator
MRNLKYALLGLLNQNSMTGYDIAKEFNKELSEFWYAKHSQIYPELKKLVDEGLLTYEIQISGEILEKKLYSITAAGKSAFLEWMLKIESMEATPKDKFRLRMYFSNSIVPESRIILIKSELKQHEDRLIYLKNFMNKYTDTPDIYDKNFGDYLVLDGAILREEASVKWLKNCLSHCKSANNQKLN